MKQALFWFSVIGVVYSYFLYPAILLLVRVFHRRRREIKKQPTPYVTLIITAFNEVENIAEKLDNSLATSYPTEHLEIIVASDASDDGTDRIVESRSESNVCLIRSPERRGKEHAQGLAVRAAKGELLIFTDCGTRLESDSIAKMARQFDDQTVGAVSSEDRFISDDGRVVGEGAYVRYEMALRRLESEINSIVGLSGSFFAARKNICINWREDIPSDFNVAMNAVQLGYHSVAAEDVFGYYKDIKDSSKEYSRKVRTIIRGLTAFFARVEMVNPLKFPLFSFQLFSHKLCRWVVPWMMLGALLTNIALVGVHWIYAVTLAVQTTFYLGAIFAHFAQPLRRISGLSICYFFLLANLAIASATLQYLAGKRLVVWQPSKR